jgi:hypothetical protein
MRAEVKEFIEKNIELIETDQFNKLYTKLSTDILGDNVKGEVTQALWRANIHPEKELFSIPTSFAYYCSSVENIAEDYDSVQNIGNVAFAYTDITSVDLSMSKCLSIGAGAFQCCTHLETVKLPSHLERIGAYAFSYCDNLKSINIPSQITQLIDTFCDCKSLTDVTFEGTKQQFKAIKKSNMWRRGSGIKEIVCSDGVLRFK